MKRFGILLFAALVTSCTGGTSTLPLVNAQDAAANTAAGKKTCHTSATLNPSGGFIQFPKCFGFSGKIAYPTVSASGTAKLDLTVSTSNIGVYKIPKGTNLYYMQFTFTDSGPPQSTIHLTGTQVPHAGCIIKSSTIKPGASYYFDFEVPNTYHPIKKTKIGITVGRTSTGHSIAGVPFVGTPVLNGVKNYVVLSTSSQ